MIVLEDKGQKAKQHIAKHNSFEELGHDVIQAPLPVGDYILMNDKVNDVISRKNGRKKSTGKTEIVRLKNGKLVERNIYDYGVDLKKMDFLGTYNVSVDTKKNIDELAENVCGPSHARFRDEVILAQNNGIKLYILVENEGGLIKGTKDIYNPHIDSLDKLHSWKNPRAFVMQRSTEIMGYGKNGKPQYKRVQKYPRAVKGEQLMKACMTMEKKYGCKFLFCKPEEAGEKIIELLTRSDSNE